MDDETVNEKSSATLRERKRGGGGGRWVEVELGGSVGLNVVSYCRHCDSETQQG